MRRERREREEKGKSDSMDLSDTLINSKLLITDPALSSIQDHRQHASESHRGPLSEAYNAVSTRSEPRFRPDHH